MRKLLALLLISLLSLQASWAAAASYCRHEQGPAAKHFGHHEHQHESAALTTAAPTATAIAFPADDMSAATPEPLDNDTSRTAQAEVALQLADGNDIAAVAGVGVDLDLDCGVCQAHALSGMPSAALPEAMATAPRAGALPLHSRLTSISLPRPERPNWPAA
jgi:hypothetical protein